MRNLFLLFFSIVILCACQSNSSTSKVIVTTESGKITEDMFINELKERYGSKVLHDLILQKVLDQDYQVEPSEIDREIDILKNELGSEFENLIVKQGLTSEDELKKIIQLEKQKELAIMDGVEFSEEDLIKEFELMTKRIEVQHILVNSSKEAEEIIEKIEAGEEFNKLAQEFSLDKLSSEKGGNLGLIHRGTMVKDFEDIAFQLEAGEISDPVKTNYGYHIIKVNEIIQKNDKNMEFENIKESINDTLVQRYITSIEAEEKIQRLIEDKLIEIEENYEDVFEKNNVAF